MEVVELSVSEPTFEATAIVVPEIVASGVSAVLAFNDQMALGVVAGLTGRGISVPRDLSVVGIRRRADGGHGGASADDHQLADR